MTFLPLARCRLSAPRPSRFSALLLLAGLAGLSSALYSQEQEKEQVKGVLAEPADAAELREQIATVRKLEAVVPDRGAVLYFLSTAEQHLGETREALSLLKECLALREGFDPSGDPAFLGLKGSKEFDELAEKVRRDFPPVAQARFAFVTEEKDLASPSGMRSFCRSGSICIRDRRERPHPRRAGVRPEAQSLLSRQPEPQKDRED